MIIISILLIEFQQGQYEADEFFEKNIEEVKSFLLDKGWRYGSRKRETMTQMRHGQPTIVHKVWLIKRDQPRSSQPELPDDNGVFVKPATAQERQALRDTINNQLHGLDKEITDKLDGAIKAKQIKDDRYEKIIQQYNPKSLIGLGRTIAKWERAERDLGLAESLEQVLNIAGNLRCVCGLCKSGRTSYEEGLTQHLDEGSTGMCSGCPYLYTFEKKCYNEKWFKDLDLFIREVPLTRKSLSSIILNVRAKLHVLRKKFEKVNNNEPQIQYP